ncbi:unnamed protein product [Owenia fusiformis]|uniref:Choline transporter-like protein n=1 Tax=Owenia fusiformis TaxID=6347 RepID=A0A8S4P3L7_OWEFU|nr:unnamed protein product [Owenia fusiformis]
MGKKVEDSDPKDNEESNEKQDTKKYGEANKYDPNFNGPIANRGCTDIICCLLFIICILGMGVVGYFAYSRGDPSKLLYPTDTAGNMCGYGDFAQKPNLVFFDLLVCARLNVGAVINGCPTPQVCVAECPRTYWTWYPQYYLESVTPSNLISTVIGGRSDMICNYDVNPLTSSKSVMQLIEDDDCAAYYVESQPIVGRCVPSFLSKVLDSASGLVDTLSNATIVDKSNTTVTDVDLQDGSYWLALFLNAKEYGMKIYQDVVGSWWLILVGLGIAMILAFIWIILMRWIAGPIVWITIILFIGLFGFGTYYAFSKYVSMKDDPAAQGNYIFTTNLDYYLNMANTWLAFGIIAASLLGIILLLLIFLRTRILIAISLIKESSRAIGNMVFALFWPILPFIFQVVLFGYWGATALFLASSGTPEYKSNATVDNSTGEEIWSRVPCEPTNDTLGSICSFVKYGGDEYTIYLQIFMLFMLFWCMNFIVALGQMTLAGSFASYYWAFTKPQDIPAFPVTGGLWRSIRYHLGSLAFGSLLIAIIQMIRVALEYLDAKLKGSENRIAKFFMKCLKCFFWCLEKFMRFLNKNAYILIAVYGENFCTSAKNAFFLIMRNILRVAVVDKVTDFLLFISKLVVVAATGVLGFFFFSGQIPIEALNSYVPTLNFYLVPVIIITIGSYVIASCFFSVYSMGVDTLFMCFLEDIERHDGSPEKPYYMSKELMKILGKKNKFQDKKKD